MAFDAGEGTGESGAARTAVFVGANVADGAERAQEGIRHDRAEKLQLLVHGPIPSVLSVNESRTLRLVDSGALFRYEYK